MTKYIYSFIALLGISINSYSQDVITPAIGADIQAKIIEVNNTDVKYKKFDSPDGPTLTIPKSEVLIISYENGTKEVLFQQIKVAEKSKQTEVINALAENDTVEIEAKNDAPDIITLKSGEDIPARVIEVNKTGIVYKRFNSVTDTTINIPKSDVLIISYADGTKEVTYKQKTIRDEVELEAKNEAPDIITLKSGEDVPARVIEVNKTGIVYKRFNSVTDSTINIPKSDVLIISYADGTKELIYKQNTISDEVQETVAQNVTSETKLISDPTETVKLSEAELINKGIEDSQINYTGKRSGAVWTAVASVVLTPIVGLIPAVACGSSTPRERNLNYNDTELKKDPTYNKAYVRKARRTKAVKVLAGYVIGSAAWLILVFS